MPRRELARWGIRSRSRARSIAPPNSERRRPERLARCLEREPIRPPRKRLRPCKHCVALAPRRSSLWLLFAEFLEAGIIPERIEHWIEPEQRGSERTLPAAQRTFVRYRE